MANKIIKVKRSSVVGKAPANGILEPGELAVNMVDGKIFTGNSNKNTVELGRIAKDRYYLDLKKDQAANFNDMYNGIDTIKDGYAVSSTAQGDTGVFTGTYVADQDVGGAAEAKILVGTLNRDNPIEPAQGTIYVYKTGSMAFVSSATSITIVDDVTTGGTTEVLSAEQGKVLQNTKVSSLTSGNEKRIPEMVEMTQADYDALGAGRPQKLYIIVG